MGWIPPLLYLSSTEATQLSRRRLSRLCAPGSCRLTIGFRPADFRHLWVVSARIPRICLFPIDAHRIGSSRFIRKLRGFGGRLSGTPVELRPRHGHAEAICGLAVWRVDRHCAGRGRGGHRTAADSRSPGECTSPVRVHVQDLDDAAGWRPAGRRARRPTRDRPGRRS